MSRSRAALVFALLAWPASARGTDWSLGTHLCVESIRSNSSSSGTSTVLALPGNAFIYQPALRLGFTDARHGHEVFLDTGQFYIDEAGSPFQMVTVVAGYQYAWRADRATSPLANVGYGWSHEGGSGASATSATLGAGIGVRHVVADRHGALRAEFRFDRLNEAKAIGRPPLTSIGVRLGFDLWL